MSEVVIDRVAQAVDLLRRVAGGLDVEALDPAEVGALHRLLVDAEQLANGTRTRLARRLHDTTEWRDQGHRTPASWLADTTGTTVADARGMIGASEDLPQLPALDRALAEGQLSPAQTRAILPGARTGRAAEADLVARATGGSDLRDLRRRSREHVAASDPDPEATRRRHHRHRAYRDWIDDDGMYQARLQGPAEKGAELRAAIKAFTDQAFATARTEGRREPSEAYAFDGLLAAVGAGGTTAASSRGRERKVIGLVDVTALRRGHLHPDDTCTITGVGPVSLSAITDLLGSATVALLFREGTTDLAVAHLGRQPTAFQRTALEARDYVCAVQGCGADRNLEVDHVRDWAHTRQTRLADLDWLCTPDHDRKTRGLIRLHGPPGRRTAIPTTSRPPP